MVTKKLHFKVDPSIINIIRQGYWYEDRKDWAMKCLHSLGGNMTMDMAMDLLYGRNGLKIHSDGINLTLSDKPDVEFQKELKNRLEYLEEKKKKAEEEAQRPYCNNDKSMSIDCKYKSEMDGKCLYSRMSGYKTPIEEHKGGECYLDRLTGRQDSLRQLGTKLFNIPEPSPIYTLKHVAKKKGNKCIATDCEFNKDDKCLFGMRNNWGCFLIEKEVQEKFSEFKMQTMSIGIQGIEGKKYMDAQAQKIFNFKHKGHNYTLSESARNQGECPHCSEQAPSDNFWKKGDKGYLGHKDFGKQLGILGKMENSYAVCFKCPKCNKHFFYHNNYKY